VKVRVVVLDDNEIDLFISEKVINRFNHEIEVKSFSCQKQFIEYIEINQHDESCRQILLIDLKLVGETGLEVVDYLNNNTSIRKDIYFLSSTIDQRDFEAVRRHTLVKDLLTKPLQTHHLNRILGI
jgi:CheY-like chemotaxis protein